MRYIIMLVLLSLITISSTAQTNIDSLKNILKSQVPDSVRIDVLQDLSTYYRTIDTTIAIAYAYDILEIAETKNNDLAYVNAYNLLGNLAQNASQYEKAINYYLSAMPHVADSANVARLYGGVASVKYYQNEIDSAEYYLYKGYEIKLRHDIDDTSSIATSILNMGMLAEMRNDYTKALTYYHEAEDMFDNWGDKASRAILYNNMGIAYSEIDNDEQRLKYLTKAYQLGKEIPDLRTIGTSATNLANYHEAQGDIEAAIKLHIEAMDALKQIGQNHDLSNTLQTLGNLYLLEGDANQALPLLNEGLTLATSVSNKGARIHALTGLVQLYTTAKEYPKANTYVTQLKEVIPTYSNVEAQKVAYKEIASFYEASKQSEEALEYYILYKSASDSLALGRQNEAVQELQIKYATKEKEALVTQQQRQLEKRTYQRNLAYAGSASALLLGIFLFYRNRKNRLLNKSKIENLEKQQKLIALDYMVQGQEEERKRIAQDLHDGLGGLLSTARLQLQNVHYEIEKLTELNLLGKAETMIDNACQEVRRIAHDMMPGALIDLGLIDAVDDLAQQLSRNSPLDIEVSDNTSDIHLSDFQKIQLFRIIQEIANNTIKHAKASKLTIAFSNDLASLHTLIKDNGIGFDFHKQQSNEGLGLKGITTRVSLLNGEMLHKIDGGSSYMISIPIKSAQK